METAKAHAGSLPEAEVEPRTPDSESCAQKFIQDFTTAASVCSHPAPSPNWSLDFSLRA